jgi:hypothetical protein
MNFIEMLAKRQEKINAKEKAEEEKAERKKQREINKQIREKLLKMKKEKAEETKAVCKRKAEAEEPDAIVVKKRGRPPQAATDQAEIKSGQKAPIRVINSIVPTKSFKK